MKLSVKKFACFVIACVAVSWLWTMMLERRPHHAEVIKFVTGDAQVTDRLGPVTSAKLVRFTSVGSSVDRDDKFTPGYDLYWVDTTGKRGTAVVTVERKDLPDAAGSNMRIEAID